MIRGSSFRNKKLGGIGGKREETKVSGVMSEKEVLPGQQQLILTAVWVTFGLSSLQK